MMKKLYTLFFTLLTPVLLDAQWNADPSENTLVAGTTPVRTYCQVAVSPEGDLYVPSWESVPDTNLNFEFWLQRLDHNGYRQWGDEGILISANPCRTWISGYDLAVTDNGNNIMAIEDLRSGDGYSHVALYCYSPEGQPVWDAAGIQADTGSYDSYSPVLALTPAGNVFVAWNCIYNEGQDEQYAVRIKKYGPDGTALWTGAKEFTGPDSTFIYPALVSVGEDDIIMVWQKKFRVGVGVSELWFSYIYAQRFDAGGHPVWEYDVKVCDLGDSAYLMPQYFEVSLAQDESGGIFLAWNDGRFDPVNSNAFVQYLSADGTLRWAQNGIAVSPVNSGHHRTLPVIACDASGENAYIIWNERQSTSFGLCGQKMLTDGSLAWGDLGITFRDFTPDTLCLIADLDFTFSGDLLALDYLEFFKAVGLDTITTDLVSAYRINSSGQLAWSFGKLELANSIGIKSVPVLSAPFDDMYVVSWVENREMPMMGFGSVYAQNFNVEGSMGPLFMPEVADHGKGMIVYPNPIRSTITVELPTQPSKNTSLTISSTNGQQLITQPITGPQTEIDISQLPVGIYIVKVSNDKEVMVQKVIKQ